MVTITKLYNAPRPHLGNIARMDPKLSSKCRDVSWPSPPTPSSKSFPPPLNQRSIGAKADRGLTFTRFVICYCLILHGLLLLNQGGGGGSHIFANVA